MEIKILIHAFMKFYSLYACYETQSLYWYMYIIFWMFVEIASVIAAYTATGAEQLSLNPGQLIQVRKKSPSGWWEGELQVCLKKKPWKNTLQTYMLWKECFVSKYHIAFRMIKNGLPESHCRLVISDRKFNYILYVLRHYYAQIMMITRPLDSL